MAAGYFFGEGRGRGWDPTILLLCCLIICHYSVAIRLIAVGFEPNKQLEILRIRHVGTVNYFKLSESLL